MTMIEFQSGCDVRELGCLAFYWKQTSGSPSCDLCLSTAGVVEAKFGSVAGATVKVKVKIEIVVVGYASEVAHAR